MMTPAQLMAYEFKGAGRNAYKADDVDAFFGEVTVNYERLYRENIELSKRISLLADKLEQYKTDETEIKQAVIAAQRAANLIVKEAEDSVLGSKSEAEAIIGSAREEADAIKAEAERQAIADSELLLSISRDKAEEIIAKAKEKAHEIIIEANDTASSALGAANRTVTSESLHFDMLKKEVSEFKASVLAQYKAHIEMISRLPEIAIEEAEKIQTEDVSENATVGTPQADETSCTNEGTLEFVEAVESADDELLADGEQVVKTELPYDFYSEDTPLEFVEEDSEEEPVVTVDEFELAAEDTQQDDVDVESTVPDIPISRRFSVDVDRLDEAIQEVVVSGGAQASESKEDVEDDVTNEAKASVGEDDAEDEVDDTDSEDTPNPTAFFDMFEKVDSDEDDDDEDDNKPTRRGFFWRKK